MCGQDEVLTVFLGRMTSERNFSEEKKTCNGPVYGDFTTGSGEPILSPGAEESQEIAAKITDD